MGFFHFLPQPRGLEPKKKPAYTRVRRLVQARRKTRQMKKEPTQTRRSGIHKVQTAGSQVRTEAPHHSGKEQFLIPFNLKQFLSFISSLKHLVPEGKLASAL